jgi:hypothetical protein
MLQPEPCAGIKVERKCPAVQRLSLVLRCLVGQTVAHTAGASRVEREILLVPVLLSPNLADFSSPAVGRAAPGAAKPNKPRMPAAVRHEMDDEDRKKQDMGGKGAKKRGGQEEEEDNSRMQVCFPLPSKSRRSTLPLSRTANHSSFPSTPSSFLLSLPRPSSIHALGSVWSSRSFCSWHLSPSPSPPLPLPLSHPGPEPSSPRSTAASTRAS